MVAWSRQGHSKPQHPLGILPLTRRMLYQLSYAGIVWSRSCYHYTNGLCGDPEAIRTPNFPLDRRLLLPLSYGAEN